MEIQDLQSLFPDELRAAGIRIIDAVVFHLELLPDLGRTDVDMEIAAVGLRDIGSVHHFGLCVVKPNDETDAVELVKHLELAKISGETIRIHLRLPLAEENHELPLLCGIVKRQPALDTAKE